MYLKFTCRSLNLLLTTSFLASYSIHHIYLIGYAQIQCSWAVSTEWDERHILYIPITVSYCCCCFGVSILFIHIHTQISRFWNAQPSCHCWPLIKIQTLGCNFFKKSFLARVFLRSCLSLYYLFVYFEINIYSNIGSNQILTRSFSP